MIKFINRLEKDKQIMKSEVEDAKANIESSNKAKVNIIILNLIITYFSDFLNYYLNLRLEWKNL